jgi:ABC-type multidrug transport system ATPase subunit
VSTTVTTTAAIPDRTATQTTPPLAVEATGLQLDGKRGRIYGPIDLALPVGSLTLVTGKPGSGKTSLLLTLVGRMRPNRHSDLRVLGRQLPARVRGVQHRSAAVGIHGLDDLDEEVSVAATVRERQAWLAPWYRIVRTPGDAAVAAVCAEVFGCSQPPAARQLVHELDEAANLQLRLALALLGRPQLVVVDDIDALHDTDSRRLVWESVRRLTEQGITVIAAAAAPGELSRLGWAIPPNHIALPSAA